MRYPQVTEDSRLSPCSGNCGSGEMTEPFVTESILHLFGKVDATMVRVLHVVSFLLITFGLVVLISLAFTTWEFLASPIFNHFGWRYWIYTFVAESVGWIVAGLVISRWFLPRMAESAPAERPAEVKREE